VQDVAAADTLVPLGGSFLRQHLFIKKLPVGWTQKWEAPKIFRKIIPYYILKEFLKYKEVLSVLGRIY